MFPKFFYGDANRRICQRIYNLRLKSPDEEIIIYKDDIVAAFRHGKYHPDIAVTYAYVFGSFLIIPIGGIFGPRDTPGGWFCMTSELRAMAFLHLPGMEFASHPLTDACIFDTAAPTVPFARSSLALRTQAKLLLQGHIHALLMTQSSRNMSAIFVLLQPQPSLPQPLFTAFLLQFSIPSASQNICLFFATIATPWKSMLTAGPCLLFFQRTKEMSSPLHYVVLHGNVASTHL